MNTSDSLLTYPEAALFLRISPLTLRKKVMAKKVPHLKPYGARGKVLFRESDLRSFLERSLVPADPAAARGRRAGRAAVA